MHLATIALPNGRNLSQIFQRSIRAQIVHAVWIISVASLALSGCLYIPPIGQQDAVIDPAGFEIGSTSRSDVLNVLGDPLVDDGRFILDELYTSAGGFLLIAQYSAGYIPIGEKRTRLLLEFNEANILERMDVETASQVDIHGGVAPDGRPLQELEPLGKLLPFNDVSWWTGPPIFRAAAFSPNGDLVAASDSGDQIFLIDFVSRTIERISPEGFDPDGHTARRYC